MGAEARLSELGIVLPAPMRPAGAYKSVKIVDGIAYVSGQGPVQSDGSMMTGRVPDVCSQADAVAAARLTGLNTLAVLRDALGSLDRIESVVRIFGLVNAAPGFENHPAVIDGFSKLMIDIFGEAGAAARCAVGASSLPMNISVEVEMSVKLRD